MVTCVCISGIVGAGEEDSCWEPGDVGGGWLGKGRAQSCGWKEAEDEEEAGSQCTPG